MTAPAGISAQFGIAEEGPYGTYVAPTRYLDFVKEQVKLTIKRIESQGLRAGRRVLLTSQWSAGERSAKGPVDMELMTNQQGVLWKHMFGGEQFRTGGSTVASCTTTNLSAIVTTTTGNAFSPADIGQAISGTGIAGGTTILSVQSPTSITLSQNATATGTVTLTVGVAGANSIGAWPSDLTGLSTSIQIGRPDITGTVRPFNYHGCKFNSWTLSAKAGELAKLTLDVVAQDEDTTNALGAAAYSTGVPLTFVGGTVLVGGAQLDVRDVSLKAMNKLDDARFFLRGASTPKEPLENGWREYTGTITCDFNSLVQYTTYTGAAEVALVLKFQGGQIAATGVNYSVALTMNARYDGDTPDVPGPQILAEPIPFKLTAPAANDWSAISATIFTSDTAY